MEKTEEVEVVTHRPNRGGVIRQVMAVISTNLLTLSGGASLSFSAVAIPQLQAPESYITITEEDMSWIASTVAMGSPIGCLLGGFLDEKVGPRRAMLIGCVPHVIGWVLIACAQDLHLFYIGRFLTGIAVGAATPCVQIYVCEASEPHIRGILGTVCPVCICLGILIVYMLGPIAHWSLIAAICALFPFLNYVLMSLLPDSPTWLLKHRRKEEAYSAMSWFRGGANVSKEIFLISESLRMKKKMSMRQLVSRIAQPSVWKPFLILSTMFLLQQLDGVNAVTFYTVTIFQKQGSNLSGYVSSIIFGSVRVIAVILGSFLLYRFKRRHLCTISGVTLTVSMTALGTCFYLEEHGGGESIRNWLPLLSLLTFIAGHSLGYGTVPWLLLGEIFPSDLRGLASGAASCVVYFSLFLVVKTFPYLIDLLTEAGSFWFYAFASALATLFAIFILPETKDKTLEEIEMIFTKRRDSIARSELSDRTRNGEVTIQMT